MADERDKLSHAELEEMVSVRDGLPLDALVDGFLSSVGQPIDVELELGAMVMDSAANKRRGPEGARPVTVTST